MTANGASAWIGVAATLVGAGVGYGASMAHITDLDRRVVAIESNEDRFVETATELRVTRNDLEWMRGQIGEIDSKVDEILKPAGGAWEMTATTAAAAPLVTGPPRHDLTQHASPRPDMP